MPTTQPKATPGYEITRYEVRRFFAAAGLDPDAVIQLSITGNRASALVREDGKMREIIVHVTETRS